MSDLDKIFDNHNETILAILKDAKSIDDCKLEIESALESLKSELGDHDCDEECSHDGTEEYELGRDEYLIVAKNMNEVDRIEKFIEDLKNNPYTP